MGIFNRFIYQTPESVELEFTLAGIGNRAYALFIDSICLFALQVIYLTTLIIFPQWIAELIETFFSGIANVQIWVVAVLGIIFFFTYMGYFAIFETLWQGQTPGKRWVKIRVISEDGRPIQAQQAVLRALLRPVDDLLFIGAMLVFFGRQEKRLGDWVAGTLVIQEEGAIATSNFGLEPQKIALVDHILAEGDCSRLLPEDFATLKQYLSRRKEMTPQSKRELSLKLAHQVKELLVLENIPENTTADLFLEATYLAYQKYFDSERDR